MFAEIGYEAFSGTEVSRSEYYIGSYLNKTEYYNYECGTGFNNFYCSILIQLQLFSTNDWPTIMEG